MVVHEEVPGFAAAIAGTHVELHLRALGLRDGQEVGEGDHELLPSVLASSERTLPQATLRIRPVPDERWRNDHSLDVLALVLRPTVQPICSR